MDSIHSGIVSMVEVIRILSLDCEQGDRQRWVICMRLHLGRPIWGARKDIKRPRYPILLGSQDADVAIVGGGMTGATVAHVFAEAGERVVVVEADRVGSGSTTASTALLMQETDETLGDLSRRYGSSRASRIWELSRSATRDLVATLRRNRIRCRLVNRNAIYYTTKRAALTSLRAECRRRQRAGFSATWMSPTSLAAATGICGTGAIRSTGNAQCDPYSACVGLLRAAVRDGARVFERSPVVRVDQSGPGVIVRTPKGRVLARRVIVATGFATPVFKPLAGRFRMKRTYVLATTPLSPHQRRRVGLGTVLLWDVERPYHYARWTDDHRLLLGGNDQPVAASTPRVDAFARGIAQLRQDFDKLWPALRDVDVELAWEGLFAMTPDGLPYIGPHRRYPRHLFALGYGGNGMTLGFLAARLLLDEFWGIPNPDLDLFAFGRLRKRKRNQRGDGT